MQPEEPQVGPAPQRGRGTVPESRVLVIATGTALRTHLYSLLMSD